MKTALSLAASLVVSAALCLACSCREGETRTNDRLPPEDETWLGSDQMAKAGIHVVVANPVDVRQTIDASGRIAFNDLHITHVYSPVTGRVTRVLAKPGEKLAKGAPLVAILSPDVGTAFSDVVKARADLDTSEADFHREQGLFDKDATSRRSLEAAEDTFRKASAEYERAKQRASMLRAGSLDAVTQEYVLRSFLAGEVIARNVNPGMEVVGQYAGGTSQELFTVGDIDNVWAYGDVQDTDLANIKIGDEVEVQVIAYPGRIFRGKVDYIAGTVDPMLRTGRIRTTLENPSGDLKPEMSATVSVVQAPRRRLAVPENAVITINEARYVYVEDGTAADGRHIFKRRPVTIAAARDGMVPIVDGLAAGERVVSEGSVASADTRDEASPSPEQIDQGHITTTTVKVQDLAEVVTIGGRMTFDDTRISHVFSPVNGRIVKVLAAPGDHVARGAPLVAIESPDIGTFMSDKVKAEADVTQAEHELQRQQELFANHIGAKRDLEQAEDALRKAKAERDRAKQLTQLVNAADFNTISQEYVLRSPIAGEVIARKASPGLEVQGQYANGGGSSVELFTVGEIDHLWVLGDVYEMDLPRIHEGDAVAIKVDVSPDHPIPGRVEWIADTLDPASRTAKVRCVLDNPDHLLKPEMYESVAISVPGKQVLTVPRIAVMRVEGKTIVFVKTGAVEADGGVVFARREVVADLDANSAVVPVRSGLHAGETVAVDHAVDAPRDALAMLQSLVGFALRHRTIMLCAGVALIIAGLFAFRALPIEAYPTRCRRWSR